MKNASLFLTYTYLWPVRGERPTDRYLRDVLQSPVESILKELWDRQEEACQQKLIKVSRVTFILSPLTGR